MNEILTQEKSIYLQIAEMIETDILRDILLEEERVPSTNELAKLCRAARRCLNERSRSLCLW